VLPVVGLLGAAAVFEVDSATLAGVFGSVEVLAFGAGLG